MIPVFEPDFGEEEIAAVVAALRRGEISGSFGTAIKEFEEGFAAFCDCRYGIAVTSGTTALHLAVAALDLKPGDEVLVQVPISRPRSQSSTRTPFLSPSTPSATPGIWIST